MTIVESLRLPVIIFAAINRASLIKQNPQISCGKHYDNWC